MAYSFKKPVLLQIIFYLSTAFTLLALYLLIKSMIFDTDTQNALKTFSAKIPPSYYYMAVALIGLIILIKWFGAFLMFSRKPWGYILYIIPNLLLLAPLVYLIIYGFQTLEMFTISGLTFSMMVLFTINLFCLIGLRKKNNKSSLS